MVRKKKESSGFVVVSVVMGLLFWLCASLCCTTSLRCSFCIGGSVAIPWKNGIPLDVFSYFRQITECRATSYCPSAVTLRVSATQEAAKMCGGSSKDGEDYTLLSLASTQLIYLQSPGLCFPLNAAQVSKRSSASGHQLTQEMLRKGIFFLFNTYSISTFNVAIAGVAIARSGTSILQIG